MGKDRLLSLANELNSMHLFLLFEVYNSTLPSSSPHRRGPRKILIKYPPGSRILRKSNAHLHSQAFLDSGMRTEVEGLIESPIPPMAAFPQPEAQPEQ